MALTLSVQDETTAGDRHTAGPFRFDRATVTVREIIQVRVRQEVERINRSASEAEPEAFHGLIRPGETERILNGERGRRPDIDWEGQYEKALAAFKGNGLLVLVDDRQVTELDQTIHLTPQTEITFLKLVPLIGG